MTSREHLEEARAYALPLDQERFAHSEDGSAEMALVADQGAALRTVVYHGLAAIAQAVREGPRGDANVKHREDKRTGRGLEPV